MPYSLSAFVIGRVQGVFFRANTKKVARKLGLGGWVMNLDDGRVEVYAEGKKGILLKLLNYINIGPKNALVEDVKHSIKIINKVKYYSFNTKYS